jgi:regulator of protease activity HflC (stomatin/prohibitin superfamily)
MEGADMTENRNNTSVEEKILRSKKGWTVLALNTLVILIAIAALIFGNVAFKIAAGLYVFVVGPITYMGLYVLKPNEALVLTVFGKYTGTLKGAGLHFACPLSTAVNPAAGFTTATALTDKPSAIAVKPAQNQQILQRENKKISLKTMTLDNERQKINDQLGNPIVIGIVVIWRVVNTAKAVFSVDNYKEFLSIQCDSALRNIVRLYPYDSTGTDNEKSLRGSSQEVADMLRDEIQSKVHEAGLEIIEARITHLSYAPEIAAAMLQRQQASAIVDARRLIVENAVNMVEMAINKLNENDIVKLDEERKAAMVSNLLVVLCGNRDAQPVVNSGSLY